MDKSAIKKFAVEARTEMIRRTALRAAQFGITPESAGDPNAETVSGHILSQTEFQQRRALIENIRHRGYDQVIEEVAYTWFNRFIALRFMEVNGYLPSHVRVFTNNAGEFKPQILDEAIDLSIDGLDPEKVLKLKNANKDEELFKYLLIAQCNALNSILPGMFQRISDYTELLFPDNLLREGSPVDKLIKDIPEDNFDVRSEGGNGQIEIIGWLYQYYISERHDEVIDPLHGKVVKKEEVPAATQLFTTDWVVRYLIDNSVGRYWIERNPDSPLADELAYFVKPKDGSINRVSEIIKPQNLTVFDPCVGSGHFLIYAFEVLIKIYIEYGYSEREAAAEIVKNNLFGLDVDSRAVQLAYFAVMMKARQYDREFFTRGIEPNVYEILESNNVDQIAIKDFCGNDKALEKDVHAILDLLIDAKEYGSILQIPAIDFDRIHKRFSELQDQKSLFNPYLFGDFQALLRVVELLGKQYAVVATNPPYLNKFDAKLKKYVLANYKDCSGDLFSVFIYRNFDFCVKGGYTGFMTPFVWMFIQRYEKLREYIVDRKGIVSLIQMEYSAYEEATVPICTFVLKNEKPTQKSLCFKLSDFKGGMEVQNKKTLEAIENPECAYFYEADQNNFKNIPGLPIAYWVSEQLLKDFERGTLLGDIADSKSGMQTGDNNRYLRIWYEVNREIIITNCLSHDQAFECGMKWFPYNKGGCYRKWYGNDDFVVNWLHDGEDLRHEKKAVLRNPSFYFQECFSWSLVSSASAAFRYKPSGHLFDVAGMSCFSKEHLFYLLALCNTNVVTKILHVLAPTINFQCGDIANIPVLIQNELKSHVENLVRENISICKNDWDSLETSWDFQHHPLTYCNTPTIAEAFVQWEAECSGRFNQLKSNEEELNRIFIDIYELQDELTPEVEDKDVTARKADLNRDIRSFISYAVGCMFGRYSLDQPGLAYAGGDWDTAKYKTFLPDNDNIIPVCDDEYFTDDIVCRFIKFVEKVYGEETLERNLRFIADALGGKGTAREVIRQYFLNDFFVDHCKIYQKRPIYWLFDSGKKNGFKCLVYLHRYQPDMLARIRTDYIHQQQSRYRSALADLDHRIAGAPTAQRVKLEKERAKIQDQADELLDYEAKIHHLANQMIDIDLDDGVKVNYAKFQDVLAKIK